MKKYFTAKSLKIGMLAVMIALFAFGAALIPFTAKKADAEAPEITYVLDNCDSTMQAMTSRSVSRVRSS